jgi:hypothetical protein
MSRTSSILRGVVLLTLLVAACEGSDPAGGRDDLGGGGPADAPAGSDTASALDTAGAVDTAARPADASGGPDAPDGPGGPDASPPADAPVGGAPRILQIGTDVSTLTEGESATFTAIVTDPDGIADLIGGSLEDPVSGALYGAFAVAGDEGAYSLRLSWADVHRVRAIAFAAPEDRGFRARFFDTAGHRAEALVDLRLHCGADGACDGHCTDFDADGTCGGCATACDAQEQCAARRCECRAGRERCGPDCVDTGFDLNHCGGCDRACTDGVCGTGRCYVSLCARWEPDRTCGDICTSSGHLCPDDAPFGACPSVEPRLFQDFSCEDELAGQDWSAGPRCARTESRHTFGRVGCCCERAFGVCVPRCSGRRCGPDGCRGACGPGCAAGEDCTAEGLCVDPRAGENTDELCSNGADDDDDGQPDCLDPECRLVASPCIPSGCVHQNIGSATGVRVAFGSSAGSSASHSGSCGGGAGRESVVYWLPPASGVWRLTTEGSSFGTILYVRDRLCAGDELDCDVSGGPNGASRVVITATAGRPVYVFVDSQTSAGGSWELNILAMN